MGLTVNIHKKMHHFDLHTQFSCATGELTAIVGPSGAGKTTLVRLIAGLERPDSGTISLNGVTWMDSRSTMAVVPTRKRKIGLVFQEYTLFPHMTVRQNIVFGAITPNSVDSLMKTFGIFHLENQRPDCISGGERQRAAFCQALAREPDLLLLDEPFSALDTVTRTFLCSLLADLKTDLNIPILHVTHDLKEADQLGDNIIAVESGRITPDWLTRQYQQHHGTAHLSVPSYS
ncbi:ATP-binding cassette domain-containing protein [Pseudodesulfovibrio sp. JC047]|uniref:ATP-binding cassette domain-containing protein n=1 Tax=Pseudodesulfovibrio sp. JC047 TaxID=2683199 RepID=UPI0013CF64D5|nr:ATP-binding cassette domain-containing protein [Pseudodesulfovibrio sp. JC047]NDV19881.1 ATP-binding cassette domain-containing protein [Pseudodesulfovibrio sp. JC047]